jgi:hypothetical protein
LGKSCDFLALCAPWNSKPLNTAAIARRAGVSRPTVVTWLNELEREGKVRLLPFYGGGRRQMLYLADLFPGFWLEIIMANLTRRCSAYRYFWWKTGRVRRVDLLAVGGEERIGVCVCPRAVTQPRDVIPLDRALEHRIIDRGCLLHYGRSAFNISTRRGGVLLALPLYGEDALTLPRKCATVPLSGTYPW